MVKDQVLAKAISIELAKITAEEIRGETELLRSMYAQVSLQLESTLRSSGLRFVNFSINWGLTQVEMDVIQERRREEERKQAEHDANMPWDPSPRGLLSDSGVDSDFASIDEPLENDRDLRSEAFQHPVTMLLLMAAALSGIDLIGLSPFPVGQPWSIVALSGSLAGGIFSYLLIYSIKSKD